MFSEINDQVGQDLLWALEREIVRRTLGRVRSLQVERQDNRIIIRGFTLSYFIKQMSIQAALDVLGDAIGRKLELDVQLVVLGSAATVRPGADLSAPVA